MHTSLYASEICETLNPAMATVRKEDIHTQPSAMIPNAIEGRVSIVRDKLKSPLSAIMATSDAIFNVTDLTSEELYEYLRQIRSNTYKMDEILNNLLCHLDAP